MGDFVGDSKDEYYSNSLTDAKIIIFVRCCRCTLNIRECTIPLLKSHAMNERKRKIRKKEENERPGNTKK
jgi:hypothetical protein